jgi:hypothetical protein
MFKHIVLLSGLFLLCGCRQPTDEPAIRINAVRTTAQEFEKAFLASPYSKAATSESRKIYLDIFIARKLMLLEAERMDLDKDPDFLNDIQLFWEQSLLKRVLVKKSESIGNDATIPDMEIEKYYQQNKDKEFNGRPLNEVVGHIRARLIELRQQQLINEWITALRSKASVVVNYPLIKIFEHPQGE